MIYNSNPQVEEATLTETLEVQDNKIILFDDDVNTFDFVIESLMNVCGHDDLQAEQCTLIVHYKGKCDIKNGEYGDLEPICTALLDRGLTAEIQ